MPRLPADTIKQGLLHPEADVVSVVDALDGIGPGPKIALPASQAALKDPRFAQRKELLAKATEVTNRLRLTRRGSLG